MVRHERLNSRIVEHLPIVDVHEHHFPEVLLHPEVNLLQLFRQSYAGWTQARPYCLPSEARDADPMLAAAGPTTWEGLAPFLDGSGSNSFVRNLVGAIVELHGGGAPEITPDNWEALDAAVRALRFGDRDDSSCRVLRQSLRSSFPRAQSPAALSGSEFSWNKQG